MPNTGGHPIDPHHTDPDFLGLRYVGWSIPIGEVSQS